MKAQFVNQSEATLEKRTNHERIRTGLGADAIAQALIDNLHYAEGNFWSRLFAVRYL